MTRILSELLQAAEPHFRLQLNQLERVHGHNNVDIKLSVEVVQSVQNKLRQLGLDQHDTTPEELYHALMQRVSEDDVRLERTLRTRAATHVSAEANLMDGMLHAVQLESQQIHGFHIKTAALKRLLKKTPPKRLIKALNYRSLDAMVRNEPAAMLVAVALTYEAAAWRRGWLDQYKQLSPTDFESGHIAVLGAYGTRWLPLAQKISHSRAHTVLSVPEAGAVVLLPIPVNHPSGMVIASTALALHELNTVAAASNYLRASQVHGDFAKRVHAVATGKVQLATPFLSQSMPWNLVQRYFANTNAQVNEDVFGPHVQSSDFHWHDVETKIAELSPALAFWENTSYLTFLHKGKKVSLNILDAAINSCNEVAYEARDIQHAQQALWSELALRYLNHENLEQAVASVLHPQWAVEPAVNE